jgi:hypothetical protein
LLLYSYDVSGKNSQNPTNSQLSNFIKNSDKLR